MRYYRIKKTGKVIGNYQHIACHDLYMAQKTGFEPYHGPAPEPLRKEIPSEDFSPPSKRRHASFIFGSSTIIAARGHERRTGDIASRSVPRKRQAMPLGTLCRSKLLSSKMERGR